MRATRVGSTGLVTSAIGLGSLAFTGGYGRLSESDCISTIRHALDVGVTMLDTAHSYNDGDVERLIGKALAGRRDEVAVATRGGPRNLRRACDASLRSLGVDHIDLYYLAHVAPGVPLQESVGELAELVGEGKIRYIGLSEASPAELRQAHAVHPVTALAGEYSLCNRRLEAECLPTARELGIGVVASRPLCRGLLTGRILSLDALGADDYRRDDQRFRPDTFARIRSLLPAMQEIAAHLDLGVARLALAWLLSRHHDVVPVPSTRSSVHLEMNAATVDVRLSAEDSDRLAELFPLTPAIGDEVQGLG